MFKPLLRTLPSLNGNIKLVCFLNNYTEVEDHVFEANVRTARLNAISSQLYNKYFNVSLLQSSYEWDVRSFYRKYSDWFYKKLFEVNKKDLPMYDEFGTNKNRNTDFEFGLKRVSYLKSNKQFGFFAPIYIENENDLPDYFEIDIDIQNNVYKANRKIRVNVGNHLNDSSNYLGRYIYDYAKKIDNNVVYLNKDENEAIYYGIDVISGGFGVKHDSVISSIFNKQNSILNYDNTINGGFERNKLIIRQIIPLSFYFSLNDILSEVEKSTFYGAEMTISGKWIKDGLEVRLQDFYIDYLNFNPSILQLNKETGSLQYQIPNVVGKDGLISDINIMNIGYPSMKESMFYKYRFSNKMTPNFNRWKLKYSNDAHPYVNNVSAAFSLYQGSKIKYGEFPNNYGNIPGIVSKKPYYLNLILPLNGGEERYNNSIVEKYYQIQNNFASNWFEIFNSIDDVLNKCVEVDNNKAFFNGILYNLQNIYDSSNIELGKIDRFGVFVNPIFNKLTESQIREDNLYSTNTIFKENSKYINKPNCHVSDNVLSDDNPKIFSNQTTSVKRDEFSQNRIFVKNENDNGDFIPLNKYGVDWYDCNDFVKLSDLSSYLPEQMYLNIKHNASEGYDIIPVYKLSNIINEDGNLFDDVVDSDNLYISDFGSQSKLEITRGTSNIVSEQDIDNKYKTYSKIFYRKGLFIDREKAINSVSEYFLDQIKAQFPKEDSVFHQSKASSLSNSYIRKIRSLISYQFNPVLSTSSGDNYAFKVFKDNQTIVGNFYGDYLPESKYSIDKDFIYVDPYNLNHIIDHYNNTWLTKERGNDKLSYVVNYMATSHIYHEKTLFLSGGPVFTLYEAMKEGAFEYTFDNDFDSNVIDSLYNRISIRAQELLYQVDGNGNYKYVYNERTHTYEPVYWNPNNPNETRFRSSISILLTKNGNRVNVVYSPDTLYMTSQEVFDFMQSKTFKITNNKSVYYYYPLLTLFGFLTTDALIITGDTSRRTIYTYIYCLYASLGITQSVWLEAPWLFIDNTTASRFYVKFLNLQHLKFYVRELYKSANDNKEITNDGYDSLYNNVYIRKRYFTDDLTISDTFIHLYEFIKMNSNPSDKGAAASSTLEHICWDNDRKVFYFRDLNWDGEYFTIGDKKIHSSYIGDPNDFMSNRKLVSGEIETYFDTTKFCFDIVYDKWMLKVNDSIWKLINLDQEHAAPYKDLYLFEFERDENFNKNISIRKEYNKLGSTKFNSKGEPINLIRQSKRGVLEPLFNIATIEDKDESKIYTEYSINNITKTNWKDWEIIDYWLDNEHKIRLNSSTQHFYRHNANNEIAMYDLSTINRDVPYSIMDKKYFYKENWDDERIFDYCYSFVKYSKYDDKDTHLNAVNNYKNRCCRYFTDTYDLFGLNTVEFSQYSTYESVPQITGTYTYISYSYALYPTNLDETKFIDLYKDDPAMMTYYENGKHLVEAGRYPLDNSELAYAYVIKEIIPPYKPRYLIKSYIPIEIKNTGEIVEDKIVYTYHDALDIYDDWKLNTYRSETYTYINERGIESIGNYNNVYTYAFYLIDVNMNNTTNSFNVECEDGEYIKYISYVNGVNLAEHDYIVKDLYKQLVPFVKNNPLRYMMTNAYTMVPPKVFSFELDYHPMKIKDNNLTYYDVIFNKGKYGRIAFERYFDNIVPLTKEVTNLITYNVKYKDMKKSFKSSYFVNETIYPLDTAINFYPGVRVYNMNNTSEFEIKYDYEWKHFNDNRGINLEESFTYTFDTYLSKSEVAVNESETRVFEIFKDHITNHTSSKLDDRGIQWAFTKYQITFGCEPVEIDINNEDKLYKLDINFTLY